MVKLIRGNLIIRLIVEGLSLTARKSAWERKRATKACQVRQNIRATHATLLFGTTYVDVGHLIGTDACALVLMLLCKFVCDGLNVRVTSQTHPQASRGETEPVLVSLALLPSPFARPSSSFAISIVIIGRKEGRKRGGKMTTELKEANGVSFFSPWQLSLRVIAAGLSSSSFSISFTLCSRRTVLKSRLIIQVPSSRELCARKSPTSEKRRLH